MPEQILVVKYNLDNLNNAGFVPPVGQDGITILNTILGKCVK